MHSKLAASNAAAPNAAAICGVRPPLTGEGRVPQDSIAQWVEVGLVGHVWRPRTGAEALPRAPLGLERRRGST